jgi:hypothetical protein
MDIVQKSNSNCDYILRISLPSMWSSGQSSWLKEKIAAAV